MTLSLYRKSMIAEKKKTNAIFGFNMFIIFTFFPVLLAVLIPSVLTHFLTTREGLNILPCDLDPKMGMCCLPDVREERYNCFIKGSTTQTRSVYKCGTSASDSCECPHGEVLFGSGPSKYMVHKNVSQCDYDAFVAVPQPGRDGDAGFKSDAKAGKHSCYCRHTFDAEVDPREPLEREPLTNGTSPAAKVLSASMASRLVQMYTGGESMDDDDDEDAGENMMMLDMLWN